jgi:hypothetical protein
MGLELYVWGTFWGEEKEKLLRGEEDGSVLYIHI